MKLLKPIPDHVLVLAMLLVAIAGSVLVSQAGRKTEPKAQGTELVVKAPQAEPAKTRQAEPAMATGWMKVPRGSLIDAML